VAEDLWEVAHAYLKILGHKNDEMERRLKVVRDTADSSKRNLDRAVEFVAEGRQNLPQIEASRDPRPIWEQPAVQQEPYGDDHPISYWVSSIALVVGVFIGFVLYPVLLT
jgi:hypothetical protein